MSTATPLPDLSGLDSKALMKLESEIAEQFMGGVPWGSVTWALVNLAVWLALWPLTFMQIVPLWAAFPIATACVALSYLPSHEAQHDIIARPGTPLRWLNQLVGYVSTIPLLLPYSVAKLTHMEHHKHTNHPELDPDIHTKAKSSLQFLINSIASRQPNGRGNRSYSEALARLGTPDAMRAQLEALAMQLAYLAILFTAAWTGHAIEAALLWWLPKHLAQTYIGYYLSWAPHHPAKETGRYRDTRGFKSLVGNIGSMGMQFHIIHHLHPRIPLMRTPKAYWAMRPILEARKCDLSGL
jgi:beta-carotene hydroxylase